MIKRFGLTFGGLQQKILNLVLIFILAIIGVFGGVSYYQSKQLEKIVNSASDKQQQSITDVSTNTMNAVINSSLTKTTAMEAYIANDIFSEVSSNVSTLQSFATGLFNNADQFKAHDFSYPDPSKDGVATVSIQHEEGVDPYKSESLGLVANMSDIMLAMYQNCDKLSSCFIATADGCILFCDDRSGEYVDENGEVEKYFETRQRPWYKGAVEAGELYFTGIELDAFTDIPGLVCAAPVYKDGELVAVVGADIFLESISDYVKQSSQDAGFICVINESGEVIFSPQTEGTFKAVTSDSAEDLRKSANKELAEFIELSLSQSTGVKTVKVDNTEYYAAGSPMQMLGWAVINVVDKATVMTPTNMMLDEYKSINDDAQKEFEDGASKSEITTLVMIAFVLVVGSGTALLLAGKIVKPIEHMTNRIHDLSGTDLVFKMEDIYKTNDEIEVLAEAFEKLSERTRRYIIEITEITKEKERIGTELMLAKKIQANMLPSLFPPFPERKDIDIYATMTPAKEVGGDFYDFFLIDDDHLGLVIADVSGKGVPAALFMMMSKILVNNFANMDSSSPAKILEQTNNTICRNNDEEMFVTVWLGIVEISTGKVKAANAGHEFPIIQKPGGKFELLEDEHDFVIGGFEGYEYSEYEFTLEKGGGLFIYTDGIAEAINLQEELFGPDRMLEALNKDPDAAPKVLLENMKNAVDDFVGEAAQFDDLTMLGLRLL